MEGRFTEFGERECLRARARCSGIQASVTLGSSRGEFVKDRGLIGSVTVGSGVGSGLRTGRMDLAVTR